MTCAAAVDLNPYIRRRPQFRTAAVDRRSGGIDGHADRLARTGRRPSGISARSSRSAGRRIRTQVIGFRDGHVLSMPLEEIDGIQLHDRIVARREDAHVAVGPDLVGRVLDGFGRPIDRGRHPRRRASYRLYQSPGSPLDREHIVNPSPPESARSTR